MGSLELCGLLDRYVFLQSRTILCTGILTTYSRFIQHQHLDDFRRQHRTRPFMVAELDLRLGKYAMLYTSLYISNIP